MEHIRRISDTHTTQSLHPAASLACRHVVGMVLCTCLLLCNSIARGSLPLRISGQADLLAAFVHEDYSPMQTKLQRLNLQINASLKLPGRFTAHAGLRNHLYTGRWLTDYPGYDFLSFNRYDWINMNHNWHSGTGALAFSRLDRAYVNYAGRHMELRIGRQLISWGQTFIWSVNDIFNTFSLLEIDRPPRQGADAIRLTLFPAPASVLEFAAKLNFYNELTAAAMFRSNLHGMDLQWQTGLVEDTQWMVGGGLSGHIGKTGIRSEWALYMPLQNHPTKKNTFLFVLGADKVYQNNLILQAEVLYNQLHYDETVGPLARLYRTVTAPHVLSLSQWSLSVNAIWQVNERLRLMTMTAMFSDDKMLVAAPSLRYRWKQNTEASVEYQYMTIVYKQKQQQVNALMLRLNHRF